MIKKNKNICFVANFGRTLSFSLVAKELSKKGYNVYWIVPNKILLEKYNLENSLYIGYDILNTNTNEQSFENERKFLYSDRVLNDSSARDTKYLRKLRVLTSNFLANNRIKFVFGEFSWAHELTISDICNELKIHYLHPAPARVGKHDLIFLSHYFQNKIFVSNKKFKNFVRKKNKILHIDIRKNVQIKTLPNFFNRLKNFLFKDYFFKNDVNNKSKIQRVLFVIHKKIRSIIYNLYWEDKNIIYDKKIKYFIYALQKKPEAGINVKGMFYENEEHNIIAIRRVLYSDDVLIVKEHPADIGNNSFSFYSNLKNFNDIIFTSKNVPNKHIQSVFTVSGTMAIEYALIGKRSFTFSDNWFNFIPWVVKLSTDDFRKDNFYNKFLNSKLINKKLKTQLNEILNLLLHEGDLGDFEVYQFKNNIDNIKLIVKSFDELLSDPKELSSKWLRNYIVS